MNTQVLLREQRKKVEVPIRDNKKPLVKGIIKEKWQKIITLVADLLDVPAGLIMEITNTHMEVFLRSENPDNPYPSNGKDTLLHGLYCETVIGTDDELHVDNSLNYDAWKDNPDVSLNMISYYGLPIKWKDGTFFGTICALDKKTNPFEHKYRELMLMFKDIIEQDLIQLEESEKLLKSSEYDVLTNSYNRNKFEYDLETYFESYQRYKTDFTMVLLDLDGFKYINDKFGHVSGDKVLSKFSEIVTNRIRKTDMFYRYGGDEFAFLIRNRDHESINTFMKSIQDEIKQDSELNRYQLSFSYGFKNMEETIENIETLKFLADKKLYHNKRK